MAQGLVIGVDHRNVMLLLREVLRQGETHLAVAHDNDFQTPNILSKRILKDAVHIGKANLNPNTAGMQELMHIILSEERENAP